MYHWMYRPSAYNVGADMTTPTPTPTLPTGFSEQVSAYLFSEGQERPLPTHLSTLDKALHHDNAFIWLDIQGAHPDDLLLAQQHFNLHPLAIEDALQAHQRAKVEPYSDFWFVVMHSATLQREKQALSRLEVYETALFIGKHFVISVRHQPTFQADDILSRWEMVPENWRYSSSSLVYVIFDQLVDSFAPLADEIKEQLQVVRQKLAARNALRPATLQNIFNLETIAQEAYGVAMTMRDVLPPFMRPEDESPVSELAAAYYRDIHDHAVALVERLSAERDFSVRAFDIYHAMTAYQQGQVTKQLAVVSTIFLPLTFLTGFFGQNFGYLVKLIENKHSFLLWGIGSYLISLLVILVVIKYVSRSEE